MRKVLLLLLIFLIATKPQAPEAAAEELPQPEFIGEKIIYDVKFGEFNIGQAVFKRLENVILGGESLNQITFDTNVTNFKDKERIFSDPETFLPRRVERDIVGWTKKEKITEDYDQKNFVLNIIKKRGVKENRIVFKRQSPIHNAILLPYYVRRIAKLEKGWSFKANLPTKQFEIKLIGKEKIKVPAGEFESYHFQSTPRRFEIWISADERLIPLKIRGSSGIGYTLVMRECSILKENSLPQEKGI